MSVAVWIGIVFCVSQSAMFSGLNLALFGVSRLRLEVEASTGDKEAAEVLGFRTRSNFVLTTILWGNVAINVLLTLLSNSVLAGVAAFLFSTVVITFLGEIAPQAYFSRNALKMAALLAPVLRIYQVLLFPVAWPTARMLDLWLGQEGIQYFRERGLREVIKRHIEAEEADIDRLEGVGALNFLAIDDLAIVKEGEPLDPASVIKLPMQDGRPVFPRFSRSVDDPFLRRVQASGKKWVIVTGPEGNPEIVLDADGFLRDALFDEGSFHPLTFCHRPVFVRDKNTPLGNVLSRLRVRGRAAGDDVVDHDVILLWSDTKRVITGADILGRLLRGITKN